MCETVFFWNKDSAFFGLQSAVMIYNGKKEARSWEKGD
ncbi:hypothetical protein ABH13_0967 [Bacillus velezensis]|uniref:Uncharacterized protein n=1 Tax=Bacillus amyloliquefaciens (strain Y2) TaxID=1155777 RepID=I2C315_BACAY|nr:hypothetical protein MUS_1001 [Bacillus velezensis YAU B9601-Y2]AGZ55676.1 hypothetical protein U471_09700 [Bacillus amyloliquefaciens CC178]AKL75569.1 hypothetical protein ABH13_0967 [Bacillus velezensis]KYC87888.1 hypothetical protein B4140_1057 [Bacillus amyloliquefaciens]QEY88717.1 hypothetical protein BACIT_0760 [Bacillus amyloliquefaciens]